MNDPYNQYYPQGQYAPQGQARPRRRVSRLQGCGCLLLILAVLAGPFIGAALTQGHTQMIFLGVAAGVIGLVLLLAFSSMLLTRRGREALGEGCAEGCIEAILGGFLGG